MKAADRLKPARKGVVPAGAREVDLDRPQAAPDAVVRLEHYTSDGVILVPASSCQHIGRAWYIALPSQGGQGVFDDSTGAGKEQLRGRWRISAEGLRVLRCDPSFQPALERAPRQPKPKTGEKAHPRQFSLLGGKDA